MRGSKELRQYNLVLNYGENERKNYDDFLNHAFEIFDNNDIKDEDGNSSVDDIREETRKQVEESTGIKGILNKSKPVNNTDYKEDYSEDVA
ncbi:MAG: hypothetical protein Q9M97_07860 [Candidatus Gracilibacteria bacterium]|nr:hypothetical protein [Candidatus Gracilibacteria bacterium]